MAHSALLSHLKNDPLPWLLEPENPSVRYWTLVDILECPPDDADVLAARSAVSEQPLVKELWARQHPEGYWGEDKSKPYTAQGAVAVLSLLHMLGVPPNPRAAAGCDSLLKFCQNENGGFSLTQTRRSAIFPCTTGQHLPTLVYFGLVSDPRVQAAFSFLIDSLSAPGALNCGRYQHQSCLWGAIAALNGLAVLPAALVSPQSQQGVQRLADALLDAPFDFDGEHKRWLTLGVPRAWDLLSMLLALSRHGYARDKRLAPLLGRLLEHQNALGRWKCGSCSRTWPLEKQNAPSKWVTLDVLRVLKQVNHPEA